MGAFCFGCTRNALPVVPVASVPQEVVDGGDPRRDELDPPEDAPAASDPRTQAPAARAAPALPVARRGVSCGQLEALGEACAAGGWLQAQCDAVNGAQAADGSSQETRVLRADLYALDRFVVSPMTAPDDASPSALPPALRALAGTSGPSPDRPCSFAQLVNPNGVPIDFFVSHYWGHLFEQTRRALTRYAQGAQAKAGRDGPEDITFWICLFALNQHLKSEEVGTAPEEGPFNIALQQASQGTVMVIDGDVAPFKRIWCLYEVQRSMDLHKRLELITEHGQLSSADASNLEAMKCLAQVGDALCCVSASKAFASVQEDRFAIQYRIANAFVRGVFSFEAFKTTRPKPQWFEDFNVRVSGLLAQPLFEGALHKGDAPAAMRYIGLGASCRVADLRAIEGFGGDLRLPVRTRFAEACSLVHVMAYFGSLECLGHLLGLGHSAGAIDARNFTPLHWAARNGYDEVVALLLAGKANSMAVDRSGCSALHRAAYAGHVGAASALIEARASITVRDTDAWTPLHCAAARGHGAVVSLLAGQGQRGVDAALRAEVSRFAKGGEHSTAIAAALRTDGTHDEEPGSDDASDDELGSAREPEQVNP